jgi:hypothetical protein
VNELIAICCALFIGYGIGRHRRSKHHRRCPALVPWIVYWTGRDNDEGNLRCDQDEGHAGPHGAWWRWQKRWWE